MEFVVVVIGLIIFQYSDSVATFQRDDWYSRWARKLHQQLNQSFGSSTVLLISLMLPVLVVAGLCMASATVAYGLLWFVLNLAVLLYAFGRGDLDRQVETYQSALQRDDLQAAFHDAAVFNFNHREGMAENWEDLHQEALTSIPYRYFERYFAVVFWFAIFGAAGALLYRLSVLHADLELDEEREKPVGQRWLKLLEWVPLRLSGLTLAIVGNFTRCFGRWQQSLLDTQLGTAEVLGQYVEGALDIVPDKDASEVAGRVAEITAVQTLFKRALICVVCVLALLVIFA